ncbi:TonB-dependent receptor [Sphingomonas psychrotolerans]|uniref:TonB-dependent receptor n=1 Tax=Sphingomonas psychrotolerans TaxID=1327635 RepID=A0ABU3N7K0_9SPHN|nr:TonB-dependent receptor [Sphingomonas psychrotolerans]MDT8760281.1 TonB-dependent receptor [Sphingomonas psychrotolerans]
MTRQRFWPGLVMSSVSATALLVASAAAAQTADPPTSPGEATPAPQGEPQADAPADQGETIVVRGVRGSLLRSIQAKRNADTIVDAISAEELGKFPNRNVAEALANIPGVTVGRDGRGEGRDITIRGLGENFAITTFNGRILPTDGADRSFAFDVLPSEIISGAEVQKAVQASALEGSIGGNVDLRTARALDNPGTHASLGIEGQYNDLVEKGGYKVSGVFSTSFADGTMGFTIGASYNKYKFRTDNLGEYSITDGTEAAYGVDFDRNGQINPDENGPAFIWPDYYSVGTVRGERERIGSAGSFQWKPSSSFELTLDGLYSHYDVIQHNYRSSNYLNPLGDDGSLRWDPASIRTDANHVVTNFALDGLVAEVLTTDEPRKSQTWQFGGHIDWRPSDSLKFALDGYVGKAQDNTGGRNRFVVAGIPGASGTFATRDDGIPDLAITIPGGRTLDQATNDDFRAHYIGIQGQNIADRTNGVKLDGELKLGGVFKSISFGGAWTERTKTVSQIDNQYTTSCNYCGYPFTFGQLGADVVRPGSGGGILDKLPGNFPRNFPSFDIDTYLAALPKADNNPAVLDPNSCLDATGAAIPGCSLSPYPAGYSTQVIEPDLPASYRIKERTWAGYAQINLEGARWRGDIGARLVSTKVSSTGYGATIASIIPRAGTQDNDVDFNPVDAIVGGGDYTRLLPAANFAYDISDGLRLRLAASKAISRPTFGELSPAKDATSAQSGTYIIYDAGNPNLKPTEADQLDASLEFYPSNRLALTLAGFYKHITNFVSTVPVDVTITPTAQPANQQQNFPFVEYQVVNGDAADVYGVELGGQYFLDNGFGVQANLTYNHSRAKSGDVTTDLPGAIPFSANAKLFYEKNGVSAQVSYSYQSRYVYAQSGNLGYLPVKEDPYHEMSASLSYDVTRNLSVYVQGSNLLGSEIRRFNTYRNVPNFYEYSGRSFFAGIRARL